MRKKLFTLMTLLLTAVTGAWAQTTMFNMEVAEVENYSLDRQGGTLNLTTSDYLTALTGGTATLENSSTSSGNDKVLGNDKVSGVNEKHIRLSSNFVALKLVLSSALAKGDVISFTNNGTVQISFTTTGTRAETPATTSGSYAIPDGSSLIGATTIYIWRASGSNAYVKTLTITRPAPGTPVLTGEWSAAFGSIYVGDAVPTPSFSVTASDESTPTKDTDYTVTYSVKAGSTEGMISIPAGGASFTLNNSVVGTATLVATLASTDDDAYEVETATYEYAYEVKAKTPEITFDPMSVTIKSTPVSRDASTTVNLTGVFLEPGTGSVTWTAVDGLTISPTTFTIDAEGAATQTFTITYSKDVATSDNVDVTFSDGTTSKVLTVNYSSVVAHEWATVSETTTWNWDNLTGTDIKLTDSTTPKKTDEFLLGDMNGENLTQNISYDPATFNADALKVITEYVTRTQGGQFMQGNQVRFQTNTPGTVQVWFSNTSGRDDTDANRRYLYVNGNNTGTYSLNTTMTACTATTVPSGIVTITAKTGEDEATMVRINKIVFTKTDATEESVTITCEGGLASYVNYDNDLDFSTSTAKAYIVTATSASSVTLTEVKKVARGTGIIIAGGAKGDVINVLTTDETTDNVTANRLKATAASTGTTVDVNEAYGLSKADGKFHKLNAGTIPAGKAYLPATAFGGGAPEIADLDFNGNSDMTTGISTIEHSTSTIEHSAFYNLSGQRVSQPTKGLYIVNGKKVVIK